MRKARLFRLLVVVTLIIGGSFVFLTPSFCAEGIVVDTKTELEKAKLEANKAEAALKKAQANYDKVSKGWKQGLYTQQQFVAAEQNLEDAKENVRRADEKVALIESADRGSSVDAQKPVLAGGKGPGKQVAVKSQAIASPFIPPGPPVVEPPRSGAFKLTLEPNEVVLGVAPIPSKKGESGGNI
jgi:hypothetical protein